LPRGNEESGLDDLVKLAAIAERYHIGKMTCLRRSLALQKLLEGMDVPAHLVLGVGRVGGRLKGHALVVLNGIVLNDRGDIMDTYQPIAYQNAPDASGFSD
jgi:hypothetical protein